MTRKADVARAVDRLRHIPEFKFFAEYISELKNADVLRLVKSEKFDETTRGRAQAYAHLEEIIKNAPHDAERLEKNNV